MLSRPVSSISGYLQPVVSQPVNPSIRPPCDQLLILSMEIKLRHLHFFSMGHPLWWGRFCNWLVQVLLALLVLSLLAPSSTVLETISYCLIWDWVPFFVASYDLQCYGRSILTCLHMGCQCLVRLVLIIYPWNGLHRKHCSLCHYNSVCCHRNIFTLSLLINGHIHSSIIPAFSHHITTWYNLTIPSNFRVWSWRLP
jgi:hypothetical protein